MAPSGILRRVALVRTDVSEEHSTAIRRATRIGELGTTLAVTSTRRKLRRNTKSHFFRKRWLLQEPHGATSQKAQFFDSSLLYVLKS
jgi:hypothetical protein